MQKNHVLENSITRLPWYILVKLYFIVNYKLFEGFFIYVLSNNIISSRDSEIVEYVQNHRNVMNQKSSFENFFGTCLSDVLKNSVPIKVHF